jgi:hypothetical protein
MSMQPVHRMRMRMHIQVRSLFPVGVFMANDIGLSLGFLALHQVVMNRIEK